MADKQYNIKDIPIGACCRCGEKQEERGVGGIWICGLTDRWACYACKYGRNGPAIPSRPFACEWCTSSDVKWYQGCTYDCYRCNKLNIKH